MGIAWSILLTGAEDGTTDLTLRISNLTMTLRESTSSYVQMTVDPEQQADVLVRPNGKLKIYKVALPGGSPVLLVTANQQPPRLDYGGRHRSFQLSGTTSASFTPFDTVDLYRRDVVSDQLLASQLKSWQVNPEIDISPGDTINYHDTGGVTAYAIDQVSISANESGTMMTITQEAA